VVYARGIIPQAGERAELWVANIDNQQRQRIYAEQGRHIYGACASPDGQYALFTRSVEDLGKVAVIEMAIIRWPASPAAGTAAQATASASPEEPQPTRIDLGPGWEPHWTLTDVEAGGTASHTDVLFNGTSLVGWAKPTGEWMVAQAVSVDPASPRKFVIGSGQGVLVNGPSGRTVDLISEAQFGDVEAHVEFCIPKGSNSGVYLMGRYEVQVYDSYGVDKDEYPGIECGGIYPRWIEGKNVGGHSPKVNASKPPGQWQGFDIVFRAPRFDSAGKKIANARFVKVVHNGQTIHENVEVSGPTRSAHWEDEKPIGPILLQGDHGPVAYRNLRLQTGGANADQHL
jgi:Domain of Unknown Function (DUF1080)